MIENAVGKKSEFFTEIRVEMMKSCAIVGVKDFKHPLRSGGCLRQGGDFRNYLFCADALCSFTLGLPDGGIGNDPRPATYGCLNSGKPFFVVFKRNGKDNINAKNVERA